MEALQNKVFVSEKVINADLLDEEKKIYILSTSVEAKKIFLVLLQYQVRVMGFVIEGTPKKGKLYGIKIRSIDKIMQEDAIYITDKYSRTSFQEHIDERNIYYMKSEQFDHNDFFFKENNEIKKCNAALILTMILSRTQKKQAIFLVNSESYGFWKNLVDTLKDEIENALIISVDKDKERIFDLVYLDINKIIVFVSVFDCKDVTSILYEMGLKQTQHFVYIYNSFSGHTSDKYKGFDWLLGNTFEQKQDFPGFYVHGEEATAKKRIVLLGNSATDPLFYPQKSWPEMLCEECKKQHNDIVIFNGAITDYNSSNELVKMFRDVILLKPDVVISYSGIIDFREYVPDYPYLNLNLMKTSAKWKKDNGKEVIYGLKDTRSAYERWLDNERMMNQICLMKNILFIGILQPWIGSECKNAWEKLEIWSDYYWQITFPQFGQYIDNAKEFKERIQSSVKDYDWLHDFTNIFADIEDSELFFDSIHVNEYGNHIVAEHIGKLLGEKFVRQLYK